MRCASLIVLGLVSVSCGRGTPARGAPPSESVQPHVLVGQWMLVGDDATRGLRLELRVDSVVGDSIRGALTFFLAGDAGTWIPADWDPMLGTVRGDSVTIVLAGQGSAPDITVAGRLLADTIPLALLRLGVDAYPGAWRLVRLTASPP